MSKRVETKAENLHDFLQEINQYMAGVFFCKPWPLPLYDVPEYNSDGMDFFCQDMNHINKYDIYTENKICSLKREMEREIEYWRCQTPMERLRPR